MAPGVSGERIGQGKKLELKQGHLEVCYLQITTLCLQDTDKWQIIYKGI